MSRSTVERTHPPLTPSKANPPIPPAERSPGRKGNTVAQGDGIPSTTVRDMRAVHSKLTEGRHMGLSTDEGISRGELREELHAFEQRLDKRLDTRFDKGFNDIINALDTRFNDINNALEIVTKALDVIQAQTRASGRWWRPGWRRSTEI